MGVFAGPDVSESGLVLALDGANYKSFKGEATTNELLDITWIGDGGGGGTLVTDNNLRYNGYPTYYYTPGSSLNSYLNGANVDAARTSTVWTFSCYVKREDGAAITSLNVYMYYPSSDGFAAGTIQDAGNGWYRVSRTRTGASSNITLAGFVGFVAGVKYYLSGAQLEKKSYTTTYVSTNTTRGTTVATGGGWADLIGNGNNGELVNGVRESSSNLGLGALVFDGVDDRVECAHNSTLNITSSITMESWIYPTAYKTTGGGGGMIITKLSYYLELAGSGVIRVYFYDLSSPGYHNGTVNVPLNTWSHVVGVRDLQNNSIRMYVNGILDREITSITGNIRSNSTPVTIGSYSGSSYEYTGRISNTKIYNRALTAAEIQQNYNATKSRFTPDGSLFSPFSSPVQAQSLGYAAGTYYFAAGSMSTPQLLEYQPNYYEGRSFCCVFRSTYASTATTNKIDLSIPMAGLLVQRDALDLRGAVYWSTPITYNTVGGAGNNTADSGTGYAGSNARRVILGNGGGHGLYNTGQSSCSWGTAAGAIGAGWDGSTCGSFPNGLLWGTGRGDTAVYENRSGTWSHWITWN